MYVLIVPASAQPKEFGSDYYRVNLKTCVDPSVEGRTEEASLMRNYSCDDDY